MLDLGACSLSEASQVLAARSESAAGTLAQALDRVHRHNPDIRAMTDVLTDTAQAEAHRADAILAGKTAGERSALLGLPIAIKDIIDTTPARCSAGLDLLRDYVPQTDAAVVALLRRAGAVIMGVAATDSGAFGVRTSTVRHPQAPHYNVGGSSGGSAAAVAAGFVLGSIGTDTGGSIRIPAACCSLAGFKPTHGRVSITGTRPLAPSLDHVGPLARRVPDLIKLQTILDPKLRLPDRHATLGTLRIGHDPNYYADAKPAVLSAMQALLERLQTAGHTVIQTALPSPNAALESQWIIGSSEPAAYYLREFSNELTALPKIIRETLAMAQEQRGHEYVRAMWNADARRAQIDHILQQVDVIVTPTLPLRAPLRDAESTTLAGATHPMLNALMRYTCLFNESGHPVVAIPMTARDADGLSVSLQIVGQREQDGRLLATAAGLEEALGLEFGYALA